MTGTGTLINVVAVIIGGTLGTLLGNKLPDRIRKIVIQGISLVVFALGTKMAIGTSNFLLVLGSIIIGGIFGEWWGLDDLITRTGKFLEEKAKRFPFLTRGEFTRGFVMATVLFCVGPMTILGSIQDGLSGDYTLLAIKSVLDGFSALAFAAVMGMGVTFSALAVLAIQGSLTLGASLFETIMQEAMITELTAAGGVIMMGISISMMELKEIKVANFLPALIAAPLLFMLWKYFSG